MADSLLDRYLANLGIRPQPQMTPIPTPEQPLSSTPQATPIPAGTYGSTPTPAPSTPSLVQVTPPSSDSTKQLQAQGQAALNDLSSRLGRAPMWGSTGSVPSALIQAGANMLQAGGQGAGLGAALGAGLSGFNTGWDQADAAAERAANAQRLEAQAKNEQQQADIRAKGQQSYEQEQAGYRALADKLEGDPAQLPPELAKLTPQERKLLAAQLRTPGENQAKIAYRLLGPEPTAQSNEKTTLQKEAEAMYPNDPAAQKKYMEGQRPEQGKTALKVQAEELFPGDEAKQRAWMEEQLKKTENGPDIVARGQKLADDYRSEPSVKRYQAALPYVRSMEDNFGAKDDITFLYAIGKIFDPDSVVREGEFSMAKGTGGIRETLYGMWQKVDQGGGLTPQQRQQLIDSAKNHVANLRTDAENTRNRYIQRAGYEGVPADVYVGGVDNLPEPGKHDEGGKGKGGVKERADKGSGNSRQKLESKI